jgi:hypothetical protein
VVVVVVLGAGPEEDDVVERPGEVCAILGQTLQGRRTERTIARVRVHRLPQPQEDEGVHRDEVQVETEDLAGEDGHDDRAKAEGEDLDRVGVLGGEAERRRELVVELVDPLVKNGEGVEGAAGTCFKSQ